MKRLLLVLFLFGSEALFAQTVNGKLVDQKGIGLAEMQLKLYSSPYNYSTNSDSYGSFTFNNITDVKEGSQLPTGYAVSNNFPNPFNPKTRIYITLPNSGNVRVEVFNILGQKVRDEVERTFSAGTNLIDLELNGLPNGMYLANINLDGRYSVTKKLMLLYGSQHLNTGSGSPSFQMNTSTLSISSMLDTKIDSLVITGAYIAKKVFMGLPNMVGSSLDLGNLVIDIPTTGMPCEGTPTITYGGKTYNTVQIGTQCWLKENLDIGSMILLNQDATNNSVIEKWCYNNDTSNCTKYGGLYQWNEVMQYVTTPGAQGICPSGWHIPTLEEYSTLALAVNNDGNTLKAIGQGTENGVGTNTSGFSALEAGWSSGPTLSTNTDFWSSTEYNSDNVYHMGLSYATNFIYLADNYKSKKFGFSVRCVKD